MSPAQKARVADALHRRGHVVGFLGDGINDGAALKAADVGVSVDSAVDIVRESADIILLEKSLTILHDGVVEGRRIFGNIVKYMKMGASIFLPFLVMLFVFNSWDNPPLFQTGCLPPLYWPFVAAMLVGYAALTHLLKVWFIRRWGM